MEIVLQDQVITYNWRSFLNEFNILLFSPKLPTFDFVLYNSFRKLSFLILVKCSIFGFTLCNIFIWFSSLQNLNSSF